MIYAAIYDLLILVLTKFVNPVIFRVAADCRRSVRWLSAGPLFDHWQSIDHTCRRIVVTHEAAARDGIDLSPAGVSLLHHIRPDVRVRAVLHDVVNSRVHLYLAWRAAVALLVLSLPGIAAAAPPPVSQIGPDTDGGFRLVDPAGPVKPIIPIELPSELPPPRPELAQSRGPTVPVDLIHQTLIDLLQLPEVSAPAPVVKRKVRVHGASWCGFCQAEVNEWAAKNDGTVDVEYTYDLVPNWVPADKRGIPVNIILDSANPENPKQVQVRFWNGQTSWDELKRKLETHPPVTSGEQLVGTVTLGSIKGKAQVAQALKLLNEMGPGQLSLSWQVAHAPKLGTADGGLEVDGAGSMTYRWEADQMRLTFKPSLRLVSKTWVGRVSQPVSGVLVDRDRLTIEMPGMIDLAKRLVE